MQQTEKYQFNLIEGSDPFLPDALNGNMEKMEGALEGLRAEMAALPRAYFKTYAGDGQATRTHTFPFSPSAVFLVAMTNTNTAPQLLARGQTVAVMSTGASEGGKFYVAWTDSSVRLTAAGSSGGAGSIFNSASFTYGLLALGVS